MLGEVSPAYCVDVFRRQDLVQPVTHVHNTDI